MQLPFSRAKAAGVALIIGGVALAVADALDGGTFNVKEHLDQIVAGITLLTGVAAYGIRSAIDRIIPSGK